MKLPKLTLNLVSKCRKLFNFSFLKIVPLN